MKILEQEGTKIGIKNCGQCINCIFDFDKNISVCEKSNNGFIGRKYIEGDNIFPGYCKLKDATLLCD